MPRKTLASQFRAVFIGLVFVFFAVLMVNSLFESFLEKKTSDTPGANSAPASDESSASGQTSPNSLFKRTVPGGSSPRPGARLSANEVAKHSSAPEFSLLDDSVTSAAEFRKLRDELSAADSQLSTSLTFAALMQTLKAEPNQQKRLQMEEGLTRAMRDYLEKERMNGRDGMVQLLGMMGQEGDGYLRKVLAQGLAEGATADQISELLNKWTEAVESGDAAMMRAIGDVMGMCSDKEKERRIGEFLAGNPEAMQYFGSAPEQNGSSLGVGALLEAFSRVEFGSAGAGELAGYVSKIQGSQAVVALDTVMNMPRDETQRTNAANALAKIGSPDAVRSIAETLNTADDPVEVKTLNTALSNVRNPDSIGTLADQMLAPNTSPSVVNGCAAALSNFTEQQLRAALGDRYAAVASQVSDAAMRKQNQPSSSSSTMPPVGDEQ